MSLKIYAALIGLLLPVMAMTNSPTILKYKSHFDVASTIDRLSELATSKGLQIFARIDFANDAHRVGLDLRAEQLLIFGNPKAGTALLQSSPSVGLDLPLKALAYEDSDDTTWVVVNDPAYIVARHGVAPDLEANIKGVLALVAAAAGATSAETEKNP
jgi:uncharacterized protein (DUF302 family)